MRSWLAKLMLGLFCVVLMANVTTCVADNPTQPIPGDPTVYPPGCKAEEPTPALLEDAVLLLVTGAYLALF